MNAGKEIDMENFTYYAPTYFAFGKGAESDVGKYVKRFGGFRYPFRAAGEGKGITATGWD